MRENRIGSSVKPRRDIALVKNVNDYSILVRCKDCNVVTMTSTVHAVQSESKFQKYAIKVNGSVSIDYPHNIKLYNKLMGGTNQMDLNCNTYRLGIHGKNWWW